MYCNYSNKLDPPNALQLSSLGISLGILFPFQTTTNNMTCFCSEVSLLHRQRVKENLKRFCHTTKILKKRFPLRLLCVNSCRHQTQNIFIEKVFVTLRKKADSSKNWPAPCYEKKRKFKQNLT